MTDPIVLPIPTPPVDLELGRDNYSDGVLGSGEIYSTVRVINLTPHATSEIKTSVITLARNAFKITNPGSLDTPPIAVSSSYEDAGYVQWEPMGDLYPPDPAQGSPLGSYKTLRVKWECKVPAGSPDGFYTSSNTTIPGPYAYYSEALFNFIAIEPRVTPSFSLTPGVLRALGATNTGDELKFQFSAHGYVNEFDFHNGLYGQDIMRDYPDGSGLIPAFRDPIYDRRFNEIPTTDRPDSQGQQCLAKEFELHGRIVPELDVSTAHFDTVTWDTSGGDAPPFWYNFFYELQHQKNVIPFTFIWGVGLVTYDDGTYDPRGVAMDLKDFRTQHESTNHGPRLRSEVFLDFINETYQGQTRDVINTPNVYYSNDDITFSVVGPEIACHASSVNVCAVYTDVHEGLDRTILSWFDKANIQTYDIQLFGINNLPSQMCWVLRGCILINDSYHPSIQLSPEDLETQRAFRLERTWAIDTNFKDRKLFGAQKNTYVEPPENFLQSKGFVNSYQTASYHLYNMWESDNKSTVPVTLYPPTLQTKEVPQTFTVYDRFRNPIVIDLSNKQNPYFGTPNLELNTEVGFLKGLREPYAKNPIGLDNRPGIAGSQPGFSNVGGAGINAAIGHPDMRAFEACTDLEWNRLFIENGRDGSVINQFDEAWKAKRFFPIATSISNPNLTNVGRVLTGNPNYSYSNRNGSNTPYLSGLAELVADTSVFCYFGANAAYSGSSSRNFSRGFNSGSKSVYRRMAAKKELTELLANTDFTSLAGWSVTSVTVVNNNARFSGAGTLEQSYTYTSREYDTRTNYAFRLDLDVSRYNSGSITVTIDNGQSRNNSYTAVVTPTGVGKQRIYLDPLKIVTGLVKLTIQSSSDADFDVEAASFRRLVRLEQTKSVGLSFVRYGLGDIETSSVDAYDEFGRAKTFSVPYYSATESVSPIGHPQTKRQAGKSNQTGGYPNYRLFSYSTGSRQAYTNSHSAYALQLSYAMASGDKVSMRLIDHYMRLLMCSHNYFEPMSMFYCKEIYAVGQGFQVNGRQEGRPLHGLVGGLAITKDFKLKEQALYYMSRRYFNGVFEANWEDYPYGVPDKPWRPIVFPYWACQNKKDIRVINGTPTIVTQTSGVNLGSVGSIWSQYYDEVKFAGDFYFKKYAPAGARLSEVAPNFNKDNSSSWNAYAVLNQSVNFKDLQLYSNPYYQLDTRNETQYIAPVRVSYVDGTQSVVQDGVYTPLLSTYRGDSLQKVQRLDDPFTTNLTKKVVSIPTGSVVSAVEPIFETNGFVVPGDDDETRRRMFLRFNTDTKQYYPITKQPKAGASELVTNGSLTSLASWDIQGNVTIQSGSARILGNSYLEQSVPLNVVSLDGNAYLLQFSVSQYSSGTLKVSLEGGRRPIFKEFNLTSAGAQSTVLTLRTYGNRPIKLRFTGINADFAIDNISLQQNKTKPEDLLIEKFASIPITQSYQNGLYYPFISPLLEMFNTYSKIYEARANAGQTPNIFTRFNDYGLLSEEYSDLYDILKNYFIRAAKSMIINSVVKVRSTNGILDGRYAMKYFSSTSSYRRPFENFDSAESEIQLDDHGFVITNSIPYAGSLDSNAGEAWPLGPGLPEVDRDASDSCAGEYDRLGFFSKPGLMGLSAKMALEEMKNGGYAIPDPCNPVSSLNEGQVVYATSIGDIVENAGYGTKVWAAIATFWSWGILEDYADSTDPQIIALKEVANTIITDFIGDEPWNPANLAPGNENQPRRAAYEELYDKKSWGYLGWASQGNGPDSRFPGDGLGDPEFFPNIAGAEGDIWRSRVSGLKFINDLTIRGSTSVSADFERIRDEECIRDLSGSYAGFTAPSVSDFLRLPGGSDVTGVTELLAQDSYTISVPGLYRDEDTVEIKLSRDINGVAHIETTSSMEWGYYGLGYVHARDMGDIALLRYILYSGRGLEYFPDNFPASFVDAGAVVPIAFKFNQDGYIDFDELIKRRNSQAITSTSLSSIALTQHLGNMIEDANTYYQSMPAEYKDSLDKYVEGFNRSIAEHKDVLTLSGFVGEAMAAFDAFDFQINPVDVILSTHWFVKNSALANAKEVMEITYSPQAESVGGDLLSQYYDFVTNNYQNGTDLPFRMESSNQWAVHGSVSKTGKPIHMIDPHLPKPILGDYGFHLFMASIKTSNFEFFGGGPIGTLFMALGGNKNLSFSLTANGPLHRLMYRLPYNQNMEFSSVRTSSYIPFETRNVVLPTQSGSITIPFRYSTHGIVFSVNENTNEAIVLTHNFRGANLTLQFMEMAKSRTLAEFNNSYGRMHSMGFNCLVATDEEPEGNIQYCCGGRVRKMEDETTYDLRKTILDGTLENTDWINTLAIDQISYNDDATYYSFPNEVPVLVNPTAGYLVCNNAYPSMVTSASPLSELNYPSSLVVNQNPPPITDLPRQFRAITLFNDTINNAQNSDIFDEQILKSFTLDNFDYKYSQLVTIIQITFNGFAETYFGDTTNINYLNAQEFVNRLTSWDYTSRSNDTHQAELEFYFQKVLPDLVGLPFADANEFYLSGMARFIPEFESVFASRSKNLPGQPVEVYTSSVFMLPKNLLNQGTSYIPGVDYEPSLGAPDALNSHLYQYLDSPFLPAPLFMNTAGIIFNIFFTNSTTDYPRVTYRVCSPSTTRRDPLSGRFLDEWTQVQTQNFAQGKFLDSYFSGLDGDTLLEGVDIYRSPPISDFIADLTLGGNTLSTTGINVTYNVSSDISGLTETSGEFTIPNVSEFDGSLSLRTQPGVYVFNVSADLYGDLSGSTYLEADYEKYKTLNELVLRSQISFNTSIDKLFGLATGSLSGYTQTSSTFTKGVAVTPNFAGSLQLVGNFDTPNLEGLVSGSTSLAAVISVLSAPIIEFVKDYTSVPNQFNELGLEVQSLEEQLKGSQKVLSQRSFYKFEQELWKELTLRTKGDEKVSEIYRDTLEYLISTFSDLVYVDDENNTKQVPCWHGTMDRLVAKLKKEANVILPVMSVFRSGNAIDEDRRRNGSLIVYEKYWDKEKARAVRVASLPPVPINIQYKLNIWTKYQEDMDHLTEQVHRMFNPDIEITTKHNSTTKAYLVDEAGEVPTNVPDGQNRIIRKSFNISVESYVPSPKFVITNTGQIESLSYDVYVPITRG